ncbi:MAG TPA: glycosyltransferase family 2 protein, partial [Arcobacter sp.]|nr:glycosyltransferase family 2 protein [Arcobacter sp.]
MSTNHISVVIIAKDAEHTIKACLKSLKSFTEVILYVNNCT